MPMRLHVTAEGQTEARFVKSVLEHDAAIQRLIEMVAREGGNPELIDDGGATAPSKRIIAEIVEYKAKKATSGPLVASAIGMTTMRERCRHFSEWIEELIRLAN